RGGRRGRTRQHSCVKRGGGRIRDTGLIVKTGRPSRARALVRALARCSRDSGRGTGTLKMLRSPLVNRVLVLKIVALKDAPRERKHRANARFPALADSSPCKQE